MLFDVFKCEGRYLEGLCTSQEYLAGSPRNDNKLGPQNKVLCSRKSWKKFHDLLDDSS